jgi:DNA polymerase III gamma/tau subunit
LNNALQSGRTVDRFCDHLIEHLRTLMLLRVCGDDTDLVDVSSAQRPALKEQAGHFDGPTYVYMISLLEELRRSAKSSGASRALADAAVVRLALSYQFTDLAELIERLEAGGPAKEARALPKEPAKKKAPARPVTNDRPAILETKTADRETTAPPVVRPTDPAPARLAPAATQLSSAERERVNRDPFVQRVTEAVEGRLLSVRRVERSQAPKDEADESAQAPTDPPEAAKE